MHVCVLTGVVCDPDMREDHPAACMPCSLMWPDRLVHPSLGGMQRLPHLRLEDEHREADEEPVLEHAGDVHGERAGLANEQEHGHVEAEGGRRVGQEHQRLEVGLRARMQAHAGSWLVAAGVILAYSSLTISMRACLQGA